MRDHAARLFEDEGFEIAGQVGDGQEAVEAFERLAPDLVTMDIVMPDMGGIDAVREITKLDPMAKARMEAEARYGGDVIKAESDAQRTALAIGMLNKINEEMTRLRKTIPPGPERDAALAELEENRKLYLIAVRPEAASGLMRPDPYAAFGAPSAATPATQPK